MKEAERDAWIIERLGNNANRDDLILELCQMEGWTWPQAETYLEQVEQMEAGHIARHKGPWMLILSLGALILGVVWSGGAYFALFAPMLQNIHEPLTFRLIVQSAVSVPLLVPQVIAGMGLGATGLVGLIRTLQAMLQ
jgi:hypothetical protein